MTNKRRENGHSRFLQIGYIVAALASFGGIAAMVWIAIEKVVSGHGLDTYRTTELVEFNWIGFLVLAGATVLALSVAIIFRLKEYREIRQLQEKYGERRNG